VARSSGKGRRGRPRILLTGATGQIGRHVVWLLQPIGDIVAPGRETVDLARIDSVRAAMRETHPDVVVNTAAMTGIDAAESAGDELYAVNAVAPGVMAEEAKRLGALLVHFSSAYVFDGTLPRAYTESDPTHPINEYGRSKLAGEQAIAATDAAALVLRVNWVYDLGGHNFVATLLELAADRDELRVVDDQVGNPTWARSLGEAAARILADVPHAHDALGIYHVAASGTVSRYDFARRVLDFVPARDAARPRLELLRIKTTDYPLPASRPINTALDTSRLRATFGIEPAGWEAQLAACFAARATAG
jgi:dTDP-4-dehydrorhamnose reductase